MDSVCSLSYISHKSANVLAAYGDLGDVLASMDSV